MKTIKFRTYETYTTVNYYDYEIEVHNDEYEKIIQNLKHKSGESLHNYIYGELDTSMCQKDWGIDTILDQNIEEIKVELSE